MTDSRQANADIAEKPSVVDSTASRLEFSLKPHLFIAFGLLVAAIFVARAFAAFGQAEWGLNELYILGGFVISGLLIRTGWGIRHSCQSTYSSSGGDNEHTKQG